MKKSKRHLRHKDRKFLDALATDKFYLEKMVKHFSSDSRTTSRGSKNIITEVGRETNYNDYQYLLFAVKP